MLDTARQNAALQELGDAVTRRWSAAGRVDKAWLAKRFPSRSNLIAGWRLLGVLSKPHLDLLLVVDDRFPWSLPLIVLPDPVDEVLYPHVDWDGNLCVTPSDAAYELPVGIDHVEQFVFDAAEVLVQGLSAANDEDFYAEAESYWKFGSSRDKVAAAVWMIRSSPTSHAVWSAVRDGQNFIIGPDRDAVRGWFESAGRARKKGKLDIHPALVVRLTAPLHPRDYPVSMGDLQLLAERSGAATELRAAFKRWRANEELPVVFVFSQRGRDVCLASAFLPPSRIGHRPDGKRVRWGVPGFRVGSAGSVAARLTALSLAQARVPRMAVVPVHWPFLRSRTAGPAADSLATFHVAVVGCGAIGGQLAVQLAQAGVGRLTLLDADALSWQNVGRHVLDGLDVGVAKALALERAIKRRFPDAEVKGIAKSWEAHLQDGSKDLLAADLVVAVTGNAASSLHLDALAEEGEIPQVVFGWTEQFGVASHAVFCESGSSRLRDIVDSYGRLLEPVSALEHERELPREASCGAFYQPYSSLAALPGVALIGECVLDALTDRLSVSTHRVWVGTPDEFARNGLSIHPAWHGRLSMLGYCRRFEIPMHPSPGRR